MGSMRPRAAQSGFTLIELLVALAIFAMLAAAGVLLLGNSVSAQGVIRERLDGMAALQRANGLLIADLAQATPRISRMDNGLLAPAFFARPQGDATPVMQFVRGGWTNLDGASRPELQKVEYWVREGRLERRTYPLVDGAAASAPAVLLEGVESAKLRFRDAKGAWLDQWASVQPDLLPKAVELTLARSGVPSLQLLFLVGPGPEEKPQTADMPDA